MIKYSLVCKDCELAFESWFASSIEYEKLRKKNFSIVIGVTLLIFKKI